MPILLPASSQSNAFLATCARTCCAHADYVAITVLSRLELIEAYEEVWCTFPWSEHLMLDLPPPHEAPYLSGGALVLPI